MRAVVRQCGVQPGPDNMDNSAPYGPSEEGQGYTKREGLNAGVGFSKPRGGVVVLFDTNRLQPTVQHWIFKRSNGFKVLAFRFEGI